MITTICLSVAATALLVPFIKVTCEHYSASEKQKRAAWKRKNSPPTLTPEAAIAAFVAKTPEERKAIRKNGECRIGIFGFGLIMFFFWPTIAAICLPITLGAFISYCFAKQEPSGAPSEEAILRASGASEEVILQTKILDELENF